MRELEVKSFNHLFYIYHCGLILFRPVVMQKNILDMESLRVTKENKTMFTLPVLVSRDLSINVSVAVFMFSENKILIL